jgi:manganese/zinc/iron transport system ATP- binding protein
VNERLIAIGPTKDIFTVSNLQKTYGGRLAYLERAKTEPEPVGV